MLDPNEWTLAFAVAVVPREHFYGSRRDLVLDGDRGQHLQVPVIMLNGAGAPGSVTQPLSIGAMENQARAYLENVLAAAESVQGISLDERPATSTVAVDGEAMAARERDRERIARVRNSRSTAVTLGADREPTLQEVWSD